MTETAQRWCMMCAEPNTADDIVCDACDRKLYLERRKLVEVKCDECGKVSEVYNHGKSLKSWRCPCKRRAPAPRSGRKKAQDFNRNAKLNHPSRWAEGVATPKQQERIVRFLTNHPELLAQLTEDSSRLRARCSSYGTTVAWWLIFVAQQNGRCGVCHQQPDNIMSLFIDHDHESGAVRGLLCHGCNVGLGHLGVDGRGDVERLESAMVYIKAFRASKSPVPDKTCR